MDLFRFRAPDTGFCSIGALECRGQVGEQITKIERKRITSANKYIIKSGGGLVRGDFADSRAQAATDTISFNRIAGFFRDCKAKARWPFATR